MDSFARHCLLEGVDELGYILQQVTASASYEARGGLAVNTLRFSA
jgi:3-isopropylmalate/(R)-2-methylmalate dehydratase small subunit